MKPKAELLKLIEEQQQIQMANKCGGPVWNAASEKLHALIEEMIGKKPQPAMGKRVEK